jgi:hypothetical protein
MKRIPCVAVIGGGVYGAYAARFLASRGLEVHLFEKNLKLGQSASRLNQSRVHSGAHYPRSLETASRSQHNYSRFLSEFRSATQKNATSYYAIAENSAISTGKFQKFLEMTRITHEKITEREKLEIFSNRIVSAFKINEAALDSDILFEIFLEDLRRNSVSLHFGTEIHKILKNEISKQFQLMFAGEGELKSQIFDGVILATYGEDLQSGVSLNLGKDLIFEVCELVKIQSNPDLDYSFTIMDGPFSSLTPWPSMSCNVLTNVKFTPHAQFKKFRDATKLIGSDQIQPRRELIVKETTKYVPTLKEARILGSEFVVKAINKNRGTSASRQIAIAQNGNLLSVLGGKIDNVYELDVYLESYLERIT